MPLLYHYDATTGEYLGTSTAHPNPMRPGQYHMLECTTEIAPPETRDREIACWTGSKWERREDYRDEKRYSILPEMLGQEVVVDKIGSLPEVALDTTDKPRPSPLHYWNGTMWVLDEASQLDEIKAVLTRAIQQYLDDFARTRNYDGIMSACTYATSSIPRFKTEGQYCVFARDATWEAAYAILAEALGGKRSVPQSLADIVSELPKLAWPE